MRLTAIFISSLYVVASVYCILHEWLFQHVSLTLLVFLWFCWFCPVCCTCISWRRCGRHDVSNNETVLSRFPSLIILYSPDAQTNWKHFLPLHWTVDKVAKRLKTPAKNHGNYVCIRHGLLKINQIKEMASQIFISNIDEDSGKYWTILTIQTTYTYCIQTLFSFILKSFHQVCVIATNIYKLIHCDFSITIAVQVVKSFCSFVLKKNVMIWRKKIMINNFMSNDVESLPTAFSLSTPSKMYRVEYSSISSDSSIVLFWFLKPTKIC